MISALRYFVRDRKGKLMTYLNNYSDELSLEKQHQLYGAINELDSIISVLEDHRQREIDKANQKDKIFLFRPIHGKGILKDFIANVKDFF